MDLIDEEQEVCFGFLKAGCCKVGLDGICVIEKMNLIQLCATSIKAGQVAEKSCGRFLLRRTLERRIASE